MQFQVPQYIDVEDKIVGPLTITQFLYIASAFLFIFITYFFFVPWLWIITGVAAGVCGAAFAFAKYNGRPLTTIIFAAFRYFTGPRAYAAHAGNIVFKPRGFLARLGLELDTFAKPSDARGTTGFPFFRKTIPEEKFEVLRRVTGDKEVARRVDYR